LKLLREQARRFLRERCSSAAVWRILEGEEPYDKALWKEIAAMGWTGATIPEQYGGAGLGHLGLCVLAEELGSQRRRAGLAGRRLHKEGTPSGVPSSVTPTAAIVVGVQPRVRGDQEFFDAIKGRDRRFSPRARGTENSKVAARPEVRFSPAWSFLN
jgi:hypothetical protein